MNESPGLCPVLVLSAQRRAVSNQEGTQFWGQAKLASRYLIHTNVIKKLQDVYFLRLPLLLLFK